MAISLVSGPAAEPVSAAEAKAHMRVDTADDDTYISSLITAARDYLTQITGKPFVYETYDERFTRFPTGSNSIPLQRGPVVSVTSVKYIDSSGATQTFSTGSWNAETVPLPGRVTLDYGASWPSANLLPGHSVVVRYQAGNGATASGVPEARKLLVKAFVAHLYENREPVIVGTISSKLPMHLDSLIMADRLWPL